MTYMPKKKCPHGFEYWRDCAVCNPIRVKRR
jgi:hypothetical protein